MTTNPRDRTVFGFPDFADTVFEKYGPALKRAYTDSDLANEMLAAIPKISGNQAVIYMLVRMTLTGWVELLLLVGNGAGLGAMKIARGMFETAVRLSTCAKRQRRSRTTSSTAVCSASSG